jgi:hypothetical protein
VARRAGAGEYMAFCMYAHASRACRGWDDRYIPRKAGAVGGPASGRVGVTKDARRGAGEACRVNSIDITRNVSGQIDMACRGHRGEFDGRAYAVSWGLERRRVARGM